MRILGWLATPEVISAVSFSTVRIVHLVLAYRVRCMEIELHREERGLVSVGQPSKPARARHVRRRARR